MTELEVKHTTMNQTYSQTQGDFIQRARARMRRMKQAAEDFVEELGLPDDLKYDIMSTIHKSSCLSTEGRAGQETTEGVTPGDTSPLLCSKLHESDTDVESILMQYDGYIIALAHKMISRQNIPSELFDLEVDELVQTVRIKFWKALQKQHIMSLKSYIRSIVSSEAIRMIRNRRVMLPLLLNSEGELYQGQLIVMASETTQDPASVLEHKETTDYIVACTVAAVTSLPAQQRQAMICELIDRVDDICFLVDAFRPHQVDIEKIHWPSEQSDIHRLKASLSIARKKLSQILRGPYLLRS